VFLHRRITQNADRLFIPKSPKEITYNKKGSALDLLVPANYPELQIGGYMKITGR